MVSKLNGCLLGVLILSTLQYYRLHQDKSLTSVPQNSKASQYIENVTVTEVYKSSVNELLYKETMIEDNSLKINTTSKCVSCHNSPLCSHQDTLVVFAKMHQDTIWTFYQYGEEARNCKMPDNTTCLFTDNTSYYSTADVLFINECREAETQPAYPEQLIVHYNHEAEWRDCNSPNNIELGDIRSSYTLSSTIPYPYLCRPDVKDQLLEAFKLNPPSNRRGIAMFVSNCEANYSQWRYHYLKKLMKHIHIDSHGYCMHNTRVAHNRFTSLDLSKVLSLKMNFIKVKKYKFLISFENTVSPEYVTEKIWHAYLSQTIPIYYGAPEVYNQVPGNNTFIDATKFAGPKQLADYIKKVDQDDALYRSYFNFNVNTTVDYQKNCPPQSLGCAVCQRMYQLKQTRCKT